MTHKENERIGYAMQTQRLIARLSTRELAERIGVSKSTVSYWESGKKDISVIDLKKYCNGVGCSWIKLLEGLDEQDN